MLAKAMEQRKWSLGEITTAPLYQHASAVGSPPTLVGFEACPGAWIFQKMGAKAPGMEQPLGVPELFTACNSLLKEGCVLQSELEYMPGPQHHPPVCHAGGRGDT